MMEDFAVTIPDIRALVAERQRFDDWLTALEAKRAETPVRVFDRVHADYTARRNSVIDNLHTHVGSLESLQQELDEKLKQLETQLSEREDERAEAMLRTAVGEFDSERWETTRHEVEASLAKLGEDREALIAEAEDVRSLLMSARHKPAEPEPEPEPLVVPNVPDTASEFVASNVASAITHADPAAVEHAADLNAAGNIAPATDSGDGLRVTTDPFLRAVSRNTSEASADIESAFAVSDEGFESITGAREVPTYPVASAPNNGVNANAPLATNATNESTPRDNDHESEANAAIDALGAHSDSQNTGSFDDIDVFGVATPRANATDIVPPRSNNDPYAPRTTKPETPASSAPPTNAPATGATRDGFDDLAFLRSITDSGTGAAQGTTRASGSTDQAKTLRCTECGTMNFPTEWYCERCGGELAAF